jgi:hypothetical protein
MAVFWDVTPCSLIEIDRRFRGACYLHHQGYIVARFLPNYAAQHSRRRQYSYSPPWEPEISRMGKHISPYMTGWNQRIYKASYGLILQATKVSVVQWWGLGDELDVVLHTSQYKTILYGWRGGFTPGCTAVTHMWLWTRSNNIPGENENTMKVTHYEIYLKN